MAKDFAITSYTTMDDADKKAVKDAMAPAAPPTRTVESLESEHFAHSVLRDAAIAKKDTAAQEAAETAMETIKAAIVAATPRVAARKASTRKK